MAQFTQGDLREAALARYVVDKDGVAVGSADQPLEVRPAHLHYLGGQTVTVELDSAHRLVEFDEDNNVDSDTYVVMPLPDLAVSKVWVAPDPLTLGHGAVAYATLTNISSTPAIEDQPFYIDEQINFSIRIGRHCTYIPANPA